MAKTYDAAIAARSGPSTPPRRRRRRVRHLRRGDKRER
jgi:hypothetical protein